MKHKSHLLQSAFVAILAIIMIAMSVGFAAYQQELKITGQTTVAANKWSVHFTRSEDMSSTVVYAGSLLPDQTLNNVPIHVTGDTVSYDPIRLLKPGDYFISNVPFINDGTFDAKFLGAEVSGIPPELDDYIGFTLMESHNLPRLPSFDSPLTDEERAQMLTSYLYYPNPRTPAGFVSYVIPASQKFPAQGLTIVISYVQPEDHNKLPQEEVNFTPKITLKFEQV